MGQQNETVGAFVFSGVMAVASSMDCSCERAGVASPDDESERGAATSIC